MSDDVKTTDEKRVLIQITGIKHKDGREGIAVHSNLGRGNHKDATEYAGAIAIKLLEMGVDKFVMAVLPEVLEHAGIDLDDVTAGLDKIMETIAEKENHAEACTNNKGNKTVH
jgi:hypothetical protein